MVYFEYNKGKSDTNKDKHGIDFEDAQLLWADDDRVEMASPTTFERRGMVTGKIRGKHYTAIITYRGDKIRIISVRRARKEEAIRYEKGKEHYC